MEHLQESDLQSRDDLIVSLILTAGLIYVTISWWTPSVLLFLGISPVVTLNEFQNNAISFVVGNILLELPVIVILAIPFAFGEYRALRKATRDKWIVALTLFIITAVLRITLDQIDVYPFEWRYPTQQTHLVQMDALLRAKQWTAIGIQAIDIGILIPLIEEIIFRFGVLRWIQKKLAPKYSRLLEVPLLSR